MKRLVRFAAALTAVLSLTACAAEVGTGAVTSEPLPCVTAEPEEEEDTAMLDKDIVKSTITSTDDGNGNYTNPVIFADVPDIDIIRVDDAFYMVSTTMHLSPGCPVMRSYDLVNWEIVNYVFDTLEDRDNLALRNGESNYGKGQWATTLRYNDGVYYAGFTSFSITGDWLFPSSTVLTDWFSSQVTRELPEPAPFSSVTEDVLLLSTCQILSSEDFNTTITSASPTPSTLFNSSRIRCSNFSS